MRIIRIIGELKNYFFLVNTIRKNKRSQKWNKLNLRAGWFGTVATVINLPPDVFEGEEVYYQAYVLEQMRPINEYLGSLNLQEIIYPTIVSLVDREKGQFAYLIKYRPLFNNFTFWWVVTRGILLSVILFLQMRYNLFSRAALTVWSWIEMLVVYIDKSLS